MLKEASNNTRLDYDSFRLFISNIPHNQKCLIKIDGKRDNKEFHYATYNRVGDFFEYTRGQRIPSYSCYKVKMI